jgi:hypothetical protein
MTLRDLGVLRSVAIVATRLGALGPLAIEATTRWCDERARRA